MTDSQQYILTVFVCMGLALLCMPGAAVLPDQTSVPSLDGQETFPGTTDSLIAGADLDLEAAPLNPAFVRYQEEQETAPPADGALLLSAAAASEPAENESFHPLAGLVPSPATLVWSDQPVLSADSSSLPSTFDLRTDGRLTPVRDQGQAGSCWTFATYASLESTLLTDTDVARDFSENNMKDLCSNLYPDGFDRGPYDGGQAYMSTAYLARWSGPVNESDDPYVLPLPSNVSPTDLPPEVHVQNVTFLPPRTGPLDNDLIKETLLDQGALWVGFTLNWTCFKDNYLTYYRPDNGTYTSNGGHAVSLVGWDDSYPAANFSVAPPGDGAFILKNSWGEGVGDGGYFYISYYEPELGCCSGNYTPIVGDYGGYDMVLFTGESADSLNHVYQYDPLGWTTSIGFGPSTTAYGANVFTAERYEDLDAVSFYTREPGTAYEVSVRLMEGGDLSLLAYTANGTMALPGYHTVSLPEAVSLSPGQTFSVVLKVDSPTDTRPLAVEMPLLYHSSNATAGPGESYVSADGVGWADLTDECPDTNLCIKAFTCDPLRVPEDYATIQEAVDAAMPGEMVRVGSGTYPENVVVDKSLTLAGPGDAVIDGRGGDVLTLTGANITVLGLTLTNGGDGVLITGGNTTLMDLAVTNCSENGIAIENSSNTAIVRAEVSRAGQSAIQVDDTDGTDVFHSNLSANSGDGIAVSRSSDIVLFAVNATENVLNGISLTSSDAFVVRNCTAVRNTGAGLEIFGARDGEIYQNAMAGNGLNLYFMPASGYEASVTMDETNTVDGRPVYVWSDRQDEVVPEDAGMVYLIGCRNITAEDLALPGNYVGLVVYNSTGITVQNVTATGNFIGGYCQESDDLLINASTFVGNEYAGLFCLNDTTTTVTGSRIADNRVGAYLAAPHPNDTVLWHNTFANNTAGHLSLEGQVALTSAAPVSYRYNETYSTHVLGNSWDDYAGNDTDGDGIGETPYAVQGVNDTCPLVESADHYEVGVIPPTPTPKPQPPHHSGGGGGGGHSAPPAPVPVPTTQAVPLQQASYQTGGQTAIFEVDLTAAAALADVGVTVEKTALPVGIVPPAAPVYEYDEVTLSRAADTDLRDGEISFAVPLAWMKAHGVGTDEIVLLRYHSDTWTSLKTTLVKEENASAYYVAETPGFSYFAIAVEKIDPVRTDTLQPTPVRTQSPEASATPQPTPVGFVVPCGAAALAALLLARRR